MLFDMETPKWTDILQAWASIGTAVLVCCYTVMTQRSLRLAKLTYEEGLRPVIILVDVKKTGQRRIATFKNIGGGLRIAIKLQSMAEGFEADNNVLAPSGTQEYILPLQPEHGILDLSYSAVTGKPVRTICYFLEDGRVFNDYIPDAKGLTDERIAKMHSAITSYSHMVRAMNLGNLP